MVKLKWGSGIPYSLIVSPPQNAYKLQQQQITTNKQTITLEKGNLVGNVLVRKL